jgi:hypothetical protein
MRPVPVVRPTPEESRNINIAIIRLEQILQIHAIPGGITDDAKIPAMLICLIDIGTLLNNGEYRTLSRNIENTYSMVPLSTLTSIRNYLDHRYYNPINPTCFDGTFITEIQNLCNVLKAMVPNEKGHRDPEIKYGTAYLAALPRNPQILQLLLNDLSIDRNNELPDQKRFLCLEYRLACIKNLLSIGNRQNLSPSQRLALGKALDFHMLIANQIFKDLQRINSPAFQYLFQKLLNDKQFENVSAIIATTDNRNTRGHKKEKADSSLRLNIDKSKALIVIHPNILMTMHHIGINTCALLEARVHTIDLRMGDANRDRRALLVDVNQLIAIANNLPSIQRLVNNPIIEFIYHLAVQQSNPQTTHANLFNNNFYNAAYQYHVQNLTNALRNPPANGPLIADINQRAYQIAINYANQQLQRENPYFNPSLPIPPELALRQQYLISLYPLPVTQPQAIQQIAAERAGIDQQQAIINALNQWPHQALQRAQQLASEHILDINLITPILAQTYQLACQQANFLATQTSVADRMTFHAPNHSDATIQPIRTLTHEQVYNLAYQQECQCLPPATWVPSLIALTPDRSLIAVDNNGSNLLNRLQNLHRQLEPPAESSEAAVKSAAISSKKRKDTEEEQDTEKDKHEAEQATEKDKSKHLDKRDSTAKIMTDLGGDAPLIRSEIAAAASSESASAASSESAAAASTTQTTVRQIPVIAEAPSSISPSSKSGETIVQSSSRETNADAPKESSNPPPGDPPPMGESPSSPKT